MSLRSLGYFLERTLVSLYDATVSDVSPSLLGTFYFLHHDEDVFKCCVSAVNCPLRRGAWRDGYIHNRGEVLPYNRLIGMCCWMGSHFHDWIDDNGVAFSIDLEWGRTFSDFLG